jgi:hypothetical protein
MSIKQATTILCHYISFFRSAVKRRKAMTSSIQSTLSAIKALGTKMGITANNIANVETEDFKKSTVTLVEGSKENVEVEIYH